jgi:hypothetical protein
MLERELKSRNSPEEEQAFRETVERTEPIKKKFEARLNKREAKVIYNTSHLMPVVGDVFQIACRRAGRGTAFALDFHESLKDLRDDKMVQDSLRELYETEQLELFANPKMTLAMKMFKAFISVAKGEHSGKLDAQARPRRAEREPVQQMQSMQLSAYEAQDPCATAKFKQYQQWKRMQQEKKN